MSKLPDSALKYILMALTPYTEANFKLAYKPSQFFNDLDRISSNKKYSRSHWKNTFYKAKKAGLIDLGTNKAPYLTGRGTALLELYRPKHFDKDVELMVVFDIPENEASKRQALRRILKQLSFTQVQRSVWTSQYDNRDYLLTEIHWLNIADYVRIYEVAKLDI